MWCFRSAGFFAGKRPRSKGYFRGKSALLREPLRKLPRLDEDFVAFAYTHGEQSRDGGGVGRKRGHYRAARNFIKRRATVTAFAKLVVRATPLPAIANAVP